MENIICPVTVWYRISQEETQTNKNIKHEDFSGMIKEITEITSVERFKEIYSHLKKPDEAYIGIEISMFKNKIKPVWEEEANKNGGKINLKIKKDMANNLWDELVMRFYTNSFPYIDNNEINGILYTVKASFIGIQLWFKNYNSQFNSQLASSLREIFSLDDKVEFDIRYFNKVNYKKK